MIPLRHPRDSRLILKASALYRIKIRTALIVELGDRQRVLQVKPTNCYDPPRILIPKPLVWSMWERIKLPEERSIYPSSDIEMFHGRRIAKWLQRREAIVRVQQYDHAKHGRLWAHEVVEIL